MLLMLIKMCDSSACPDYLAYLFVTRQWWQESYHQLSDTHPPSNFCCTGRHSQGAQKAQYFCRSFKHSQVFRMSWNICSRSKKQDWLQSRGTQFVTSVSQIMTGFTEFYRAYNVRNSWPTACNKNSNNNSRQCLCNAYYATGTFLRTLCKLTHLRRLYACAVIQSEVDTFCWGSWAMQLVGS